MNEIRIWKILKIVLNQNLEKINFKILNKVSCKESEENKVKILHKRKDSLSPIDMVCEDRMNGRIQHATFSKECKSFTSHRTNPNFNRP